MKSIHSQLSSLESVSMTIPFKEQTNFAQVRLILIPPTSACHVTVIKYEGMGASTKTHLPLELTTSCATNDALVELISLPNDHIYYHISKT